MTARLTATAQLPPGVARPGYDRDALGPGIVHLGLGAFHKAHQAVYTDDALAATGGDWRIVGVSLRSAEPAAELTPQDGLYTVIERDVDGTRARIIGALAAALHLPSDPSAVLDALCAPATRIVSLTVTEKGYGIDRDTGGADPSHPAIAADLANPEAPRGVAGLLVYALARRRAAGTPPFTVLCCDNLPENGPMVRSLLIDFARRTRPELEGHIERDVAFPATMVDRITPARTDATLALVAELLGHADHAAIDCEGFRQWVIEDHFPTCRPSWEAGGALFVQDVRPFEDMKLRMLNGSHSMLAYAGHLAGHRYVRDVMADPGLAALVGRHFAAAAGTLDPLPGMDLDAYAHDLGRRFANPHLAHETYQIAMDGSQKMPQRIFAPAAEALRRGQPLDAFAFATAAWLRFTLGEAEDGSPYALRDPLEDRLRPGAQDARSAEAIMARVLTLPGLLPDTLAQSGDWHTLVRHHLDVMLTQGMAQAIRAAAA